MAFKYVWAQKFEKRLTITIYLDFGQCRIILALGYVWERQPASMCWRFSEYECPQLRIEHEDR